MKQFMIVACAVIVTLLSTLPVSAIEASLPPEKLNTSPVLISAYYIDTNTPGYIELYNNGSEPFNLKNTTIQIKWSAIANAPSTTIVTNPLTLPLSGSDAYLPPRQFAVVSFGGIVNGASLSMESVAGNDQTFVSEISVRSDAYKPYVKSFAAVQTQRMMLNETTTGYTSTGAYSLDTRSTLFDSGLFRPNRLDFPLAPTEILSNPRNCPPLDSSIDCREYIEFYNSTTETVSFDGVRLRIGYQGQSATSSNSVLLSGELKPGEYAIFNKTASGGPLSITNTGGYVWLEDMYGVNQFPSTVVGYADASSTTRKGSTWANVDGVWQWGVATAGFTNKALAVDTISSTVGTLTPCRPDQYRSAETNRCRSITTNSEPTPCNEDQYRNPETGRCKKIASSTGSLLQPCDAGQYRNPETNRCKSIASQASSLVPCQAGWERNPETNRCRKATTGTVPKADFGVESYEEGKATGYGWAAFAAVGGAVVAYGLWEWRHEFTVMWRRFTARRVQ